MTKVKKIVAVVGMIVVGFIILGLGYAATNDNILEGRNILPIYVEYSELIQNMEDNIFADCFDNVCIVGEADENLDDKLEEYNSMIVDFYQQEGVDFSDKIEKLKTTYIFDDKNENVQLDGYIESDGLDIYLSKKLVEEGGNELRDVYVHEINHYLWAQFDDMYYMSEGFADYVAKLIVGDSYEISDAYHELALFAEQLAIADPEILPYLYNGGCLSDRINEKLEGVEIWYYGIGMPPDDIATYMSVLLACTMNPETDNENWIASIFQVQHIIVAYARECALSTKQIKALNRVLILRIDSMILERDGIYEYV